MMDWSRINTSDVGADFCFTPDLSPINLNLSLSSIILCSLSIHSCSSFMYEELSSKSLFELLFNILATSKSLCDCCVLCHNATVSLMSKGLSLMLSFELLFNTLVGSRNLCESCTLCHNALI